MLNLGTFCFFTRPTFESTVTQVTAATPSSWEKVTNFPTCPIFQSYRFSVDYSFEKYTSYILSMMWCCMNFFWAIRKHKCLLAWNCLLTRRTSSMVLLQTGSDFTDANDSSEVEMLFDTFTLTSGSVHIPEVKQQRHAAWHPKSHLKKNEKSIKTWIWLCADHWVTSQPN